MNLIMLAAAAAVVCAACGSEAVPVYRCPKAGKAPVIDGKLDDEAWKLAPAVRLVLATTGKPVTKTTTARMCWDDKCLYIAFDSVDTDIWGTYTKRDEPVHREEVVEAFLSPDCSLTRYFEFNVSPRNVQFDALVANPDGKGPGEGTDTGWNCEGLRTAVCINGTLDDRTDKDKGWTAELAVPFASLGRKAPKQDERWRGNLYRIDLNPDPVEFMAWSPTLTPAPAFHIPDRFGTIVFTRAR